MLTIRLQRTGRKHEPTFRFVLTDSKNGPKSGKFLEILGSYDPRHKDATAIKSDRVKELISTGAQVSDTVHNILVDKKIIDGKKINVLPKKSPIKKEGEEAPAAEVPVAEAAPAPEAVQEEAAPVAEETPTEAPATEEKPAE